VLEALQRAIPKLENASIEDISLYLDSMDSPEQMQGVVNNVKGILGEFEAQEYFESIGYDAPIAENLYNPGFDIALFDDKNLVDVVQIKTTSNPVFIENHLEKYPDIPVYATQDVYDKMDYHKNLEMLPFSSSQIEHRIDDTFDNLDSLDSLAMGNILEGGIYSLIFSSAMNGFILSNNGLSGDQFSRIATRTTIKTVGAGIGASVFGPAGMLGMGFLFGKIYDYYGYKPMNNQHYNTNTNLSLDLRQFLPKEFKKWRDNEIQYFAKESKKNIEESLNKDKNLGIMAWNLIYRENSKMEPPSSTREMISLSQGMRQAMMKNKLLKNIITNIGLIDDRKILSELPRLGYFHTIFSWSMVEAYLFSRDSRGMLIIADEIMQIHGISLNQFNNYVLSLRNI
jgi:hypothetical protein